MEFKLTRSSEGLVAPHGATWPDNCVVCAAPTGPERVALTVSDGGTVIGRMGGAVGRLLTASRRRVSVPFCADHLRSHRREPRIAAGVLGGLWLGMVGMTWYLSGDLLGGLVLGIPLGIGVALLGLRLVTEKTVVRLVRETPSGLVLEVGSPFLELVE